MTTFKVNIVLIENEQEILVGQIAVKAANKKEAIKQVKKQVSFSTVYES